MEEVEGARIVGADLLVMAVAQEKIELIERFRDVGVPDAVDDVDHLTGLRMGELEFVLEACERQVVVLVGKESGGGESCIDEAMSEGVEAGMSVRRRPAGACERNDNEEKRDQEEG